MEARKKIRLGDLLVENGIITAEQLDAALVEQRKLGRKLGHTLIEMGFLSEDELLRFLSRQLRLPLVDLKHYRFEPETVRLLPETVARRYRAVVLEDRDAELLVGMADPTDLYAHDEIARRLARPVRAAIVRESELLATFDLVYRRTEEISLLAEELGQELSEGDFDLDEILRGTEMVDAPVAKLLQSLFEDAVQVGASDIHIEPDEQVLRIRQRVDGVLQEQEMKERRIAAALVLRLKLMAGLDISERRLPQDGRFNIRVKGHGIDVRLATMPVQHGESVVMRLLDQSTGLLQMEHLGMADPLLERLRRTIHLPHGMVVVTGPTGSGKTTTLYAALQELNRAEKKIITVEDPVEYRLPRINQVQVHPRIGLGFARVLRSALRHDPDIIMIGEMRDQETVEIGVSAALTGHLVLSTLHTNDTVSTALRLLDMGAEGYLLAATLRGIVAQRLLRRICDGCAAEQAPSPQEQAWLERVAGPAAAGATLKRGAGCPHCGFTGYQGRIGVFELLEVDRDMATALRDEDASAFTAAAGRARHFVPLLQVAVQHALRGETTVEEVMRVAGQDLEPDAGPVAAAGPAGGG